MPKLWDALPQDWRALMGEEFLAKQHALADFVEAAYETEAVLPPRADLFTALRLCPVDAARVVILGQDPYPTPGVAHGLAFSTQQAGPLPASLRNIVAEVASDTGAPAHIAGGNLTPWAEQGVLLLNALLTTREREPLAHAKRGWEVFTAHLLQRLAAARPHLVFLLWGAHAQKAVLPWVDAARHTVLCSVHPSPLSARRGFFGSAPFTRANAALAAHGQAPIVW